MGNHDDSNLKETTTTSYSNNIDTSSMATTTTTTTNNMDTNTNNTKNTNSTHNSPKDTNTTKKNKNMAKKKKSPALRAFQIFLFSALYHSLANLILRGHANLYHELRFFLVNFLLCYLETLASKFFAHTRKRVASFFGMGGFHERDEKKAGGEDEGRKLGSGELEAVSAGGSGDGSGSGRVLQSGKGLLLLSMSSLLSVFKRLAGYLWVYTVFFCIAPAWQWSQAWALFERLLEEARKGQVQV